MAIAKIISRKKIWKSQKFCDFSTLGRKRKKFGVNNARADLLNMWASKYLKFNNFLGAILFWSWVLQHISNVPWSHFFLLLLLFLLLWFCLCVFSFFICYWKESPNDFFVIGFRYKVRLTVFSCRANGRWFTTLPLIVTVTSHGTSSQSTTFDCKPSTTKKLRYAKINTHKSIPKQPFLKLSKSEM